MAGVTAALLIFFGFIIFRIADTPMATLYSGLDPSDAGRIVTQLESLGIEHEIRGDGSTIAAARAEIPRLRMLMAEQGLPNGGSVGYEIFDDRDALGTTSFVQNLNHLRALEGELARTIQSIAMIDAARVHLVIPKRELFSKEGKTPTASIVLRARGDGLPKQQIKSIQHLVSSAVQGLKPGAVSVVDEQGNLLASGREGDDETDMSSTIAERNAAYENRIRTQVEQIVSSIVGVNGARVQVAAEMDFNRVTQSSEIYDPDGQVVRSTQVVEESSANSERDGASKEVGVATELPDADVTDSADGPTSSTSNNRIEETINYEISRTTKTEVLEVGRVKRLSVAVLVDGTYTNAADGARTYAPRGQEEIDQITALVKSGIGFDAARGDLVEVINLQFVQTMAPEPLEASTPFLGLEKADYMRIGEITVLGAVSILLILMVFRPMMAGILTASPAGAAPALPGQLEASGVDSQAQAQLPAPGAAAPAALPGSAAARIAATAFPGSAQSSIDISQVEGQVKESAVKKVGEIVQKHPDEAMAIMRNWLYQAD
jgi:flagellar M-ring protein FliF